LKTDPGVVIYADPPYLAKGAEYLHDFDWLAHRRLATVLRRFQKTRVVISYYDHPDLAAMYPGWTKVDCAMTRAMASQGQRGERGNAEKAPEVLLINGPSFTGGGAA
jgi:DNA adenine methylase